MYLRNLKFTEVPASWLISNDAAFQQIVPLGDKDKYDRKRRYMERYRGPFSYEAKDGTVSIDTFVYQPYSPVLQTGYDIVSRLSICVSEASQNNVLIEKLLISHKSKAHKNVYIPVAVKELHDVGYDSASALSSTLTIPDNIRIYKINKINSKVLRDKFFADHVILLNNRDAIADNSCVICLDSLEKYQSFQLKSCNHKFHVLCFDAYVKSLDGKIIEYIKCPLCNVSAMLLSGKSPDALWKLELLDINNESWFSSTISCKPGKTVPSLHDTYVEDHKGISLHFWLPACKLGLQCLIVLQKIFDKGFLFYVTADGHVELNYALKFSNNRLDCTSAVISKIIDQIKFLIDDHKEIEELVAKFLYSTYEKNSNNDHINIGLLFNYFSNALQKNDFVESGSSSQTILEQDEQEDFSDDNFIVSDNMSESDYEQDSDKDSFIEESDLEAICEESYDELDSSFSSEECISSSFEFESDSNSS